MCHLQREFPLSIQEAYKILIVTVWVYAPGPNMTAFHTMILSGHGLPEIPPGGSVERRLKSRMRRRLQLVD